MASISSPPAAHIERFRVDMARLGGPYDRIGLAVSGGPDSLAMLLLACAAFPGQVEAATVDHSLRPESEAEATRVAYYCGLLAIPHASLKVEIVPSGDGLQADARKARYSALADWLKARTIQVLLTAHHADDQAETLLMRLLRGSGVAGLAGIRARTPFPAAGDQATMVRPLLGWRRSELAGIVTQSGLEPVTDPSNEDDRFDRARLRKDLAVASWLDPAPLARSAAALADAEEGLKAAAEILGAARIEQRGDALHLAIDGLPNELLRRLILTCLHRVAADGRPRGEQVTALLDQLQAGQTATLAGVKCSRRGQTFLFEPAPPRRARG